MIRFTCSRCGKSLRASDSIVGKKAKCTRCGNVEEVPPFSTRKSTSKKRREKREEIVSVDSDSFFDFSDVDVAIREGNQQRSQTVKAVSRTDKAEPLEKTNEAKEDVDRHQAIQPVFKSVPQKTLNAQKMGSYIAVAAIVAVGILLIAYLSGFLFGKRLPDSKFARTQQMMEHETALFELNKANRVLKIMSKGYRAAKGSDLSEFSKLEELQDQVEKATQTSEMIAEAEELFRLGDEAIALGRISDSTELMRQLRTEVEKQTQEIRDETYQ